MVVAALCRVDAFRKTNGVKCNHGGKPVGGYNSRRMGLDMQPGLLWNGLVQSAFMCFNGLVKVPSIINFRICDKTWKLMFAHTPSDLNELELFWKE